MFELRHSISVVHRYNVNSDRFALIFHLKFTSKEHEFTLFNWSNHLDRRAKSIASFRLYFNQNERVSVFSENIDLAEFSLKVSTQYRQLLLLKKLAR